MFSFKKNKGPNHLLFVIRLKHDNFKNLSFVMLRKRVAFPKFVSYSEFTRKHESMRVCYEPKMIHLVMNIEVNQYQLSAIAGKSTQK